MQYADTYVKRKYIIQTRIIFLQSQCIEINLVYYDRLSDSTWTSPCISIHHRDYGCMIVSLSTTSRIQSFARFIPHIRKNVVQYGHKANKFHFLLFPFRISKSDRMYIISIDNSVRNFKSQIPQSLSCWREAFVLHTYMVVDGFSYTLCRFRK